MAETSYRQALHDTLREELLRDDSVILLGEEIGVFEGSYKITAGLLSEFGPQRVLDTPICEEGFVGAAVGAAMLGMRPVVELMTINFSLLAIDQIVNHAAKIHAMFGGQVSVPMVIRTPGGGGQQLAATHSQNLEVWYAHVPGMKVVAPATPADARSLLTAAIRDDDPVLVLENLALYNTRGEVPEAKETVRIGTAMVARPGEDITVVAYSRATVIALDVARQLAEQGISVEVVDLRSLRPLDHPSRRPRGRLADVRRGCRGGRDHPGGCLRLPRRPGAQGGGRGGAAALREDAGVGRSSRRVGPDQSHR
jgi:pyruvate dehydrogenase E1 component beta subunit